jgi:hypothetical protein
MDQLALFNAVAKKAKPMHRKHLDIQDLNIPFTEADIDSLDVILICMYFCEIYGIDEQTAQTMLPDRPQKIFEFLDEHKTRDPQTLEEAMGYIQ